MIAQDQQQQQHDSNYADSPSSNRSGKTPDSVYSHSPYGFQAFSESTKFNLNRSNELNKSNLEEISKAAAEVLPPQDQQQQQQKKCRPTIKVGPAPLIVRKAGARTPETPSGVSNSSLCQYSHPSSPNSQPQQQQQQQQQQRTSTNNQEELELVHESNSGDFTTRDSSAPSSTRHSSTQMLSRCSTPSSHVCEDARSVASTVTNASFSLARGRVAATIRTAKGSTAVQSTIKESVAQFGAQAVNDACPLFQQIRDEVFAEMLDLLLDDHACYTAQLVLEHAPYTQTVAMLRHAARYNLGGLVQLCTKSLHSRRMVQFFGQHLLPADMQLFVELVVANVEVIGLTQQGSVTVQRVAAAVSLPERERIFDAVRQHAGSFCTHPFGNFVLQHVLEQGNAQANVMWMNYLLTGNFYTLATHKFASNVLERVFAFPQLVEVQRTMMTQLSCFSAHALTLLVQDRYGNYLVQTIVARGPYREMQILAPALESVLPYVQYGAKLGARIAKRLGSHGAMSNCHQQQQYNQQRHNCPCAL